LGDVIEFARLPKNSVRIDRMAASTTSGFSLHVASPARAIPAPQVRSFRPRRISPEAGHALEKLGHAIEYLSDELVHEGGELTQHNPQVEAVQLLMAINRQIYFSCPEVPSWGDRFKAFLYRTTL
jgi:hypothetical protein